HQKYTPPGWGCASHCSQKNFSQHPGMGHRLGRWQRRYCFFTRILPLKDCNSIEDDPELEVPTKERPVEGTNVLWSFCWRGKSFSTDPVMERAVRSTDAFWGRATWMAPL